MADILIRGVQFPTMAQAYKTLIVSYDLFIATCNDSTGKDMTATFWTLLEETL